MSKPRDLVSRFGSGLAHTRRGIASKQPLGYLSGAKSTRATRSLRDLSGKLPTRPGGCRVDRVGGKQRVDRYLGSWELQWVIISTSGSFGRARLEPRPSVRCPRRTGSPGGAWVRIRVRPVLVGRVRSLHLAPSVAGVVSSAAPSGQVTRVRLPSAECSIECESDKPVLSTSAPDTVRCRT